MDVAAEFFLFGDLFEFGLAADEVVGIMGYPDGLDVVFCGFTEKLPLGEMSEFAKEGLDFPGFQGRGEFAGMGQIGGVDVPDAGIFKQYTVTVEAGVGIGAFEVVGKTAEVLGGKRREGEGAMVDGAAGFDLVPMDGEADKLGKKEALFEPVFHRAHDLGGAENVQRSAARAKPE